MYSFFGPPPTRLKQASEIHLSEFSDVKKSVQSSGEAIA